MKDKKEIRKWMLDRRNDLDDNQLDQMSSQIASNFFDAFDLSTISTIHVYLPIVTKVEVNTWKIINRLSKDFPNIRIVIPKTTKDLTLDSYIFVQENLKVNSWGIPEPVKGDVIDDSEIDLVLVPLLAFDKNGYRVGYGKGFYDRFLEPIKDKVLKVGISCCNEVVEFEGIDQYDVPLDYCVTPNKVWKF